MSYSADDIRCANDRKLFDTLSNDLEIIRAKEAIEKAAKKGPPGTRRRLLSSSVRLSPGMAPSVHRMKDECVERLALQLFAWSRYAEISADCAGAHCAGSFESVGSALFRLASGLSENVVRFKLDEFLDQLDDIQIEIAQPGGGGPREDWFSTHPFSPLRVKALDYFFRSEFVRQDGLPADELEASVHHIMAIMEPSYVDGRTRTTEAMRRLLFAGSALIASAGDGMDQHEIEQFEKFFGKDSLPAALDLDRLRAEMPGRIQQVRDLSSVAQCLQVMRDLLLIARANGTVSEPERDMLAAIAAGLNVSSAFLDSVLYSDPELD